MATSVAHGIPEEFRRQFNDNLTHVIQQEESRLAPYVPTRDFSGKEEILNDLDDFEFVERQGRLTQSTPDEIQLHARKRTKRSWKCQKIFDRDDNEFLGNLGRPDSETLQAMSFAVKRLRDEKLVEAATATVYGGLEPYVTAIDLPASQQVPVNYVETGGTPANVGLTPQKIIRAAAIYEENEIMPTEDELVLVTNPKGKQDLMVYVQTAPNDVWARMITAWLEGKEKKLFGFNVVISNDITPNGSDISTAITFSKQKGLIQTSGMLKTEMDIRADLDHALQVSCYLTAAYTRRYEKGVVTIACDESP